MEYFADLVGVSHRDAAAKAIVQTLAAGEHLDLVREPTNQFDPNAIQVFWGETWLGYIDRMTAATLAPKIDADQPFTCSVIQPDQHSPMVKVQFLDAD